MRRLVSRRAPAKLNLTLAVLGERGDGYHDLHSVMVPLDLADTVTVALGNLRAGDDTLRIEYRGTGPVAVPVAAPAAVLAAGPDNLVLRAIAAARAAAFAVKPDKPPRFLEASLEKVIPVAAGLGGGSSDAAAAMGAALEFWRTRLPLETARGVAASLGSDVPFFLAGGAALVGGRGEHVDPLPPLRGVAPAVLLVTPRLHVSTAAVFAAYAAGARPGADPGHASARGGATALSTSERLAADMRAGMTTLHLLARAAELAAANDLLPATLQVAPELGAFRMALARLLGRPIGQSGSGPTAWVLYPSAGAAQRAAAAIRRAGLGGSAGEPFVAVTSIVSGAQ